MVKQIQLKQQEKILKMLQSRFENNLNRHKNIKWTEIERKLRNEPKKILILNEMERTGGEPDVVGYDNKSGVYIFMDCSPESPSERRSLCYDRRALNERKAAKPKNSATDLAQKIGVEILDEEQYRELQNNGEFDTKTSSWIKTPPEIRERGGALFCDRRYDKVFVYHNGADSYYDARGFRGLLRV